MLNIRNVVNVGQSMNNSNDIVVDSEISATSENPVQNKVIYSALQGKQDTLVSGTNIKTVNNTSLLGSGNITIDSLPSQTGNSGKFLTTNGTAASWATVSGGVPTLTWFTGNTGNTLNTGLDLSGANLVKVYKNGLLLEPNQENIILTSYTGTSGGYLMLKNRPPLDTANTWSIDFHLSTWTPLSFAWPFGNSVTTDCTTPGLGFESGALHMFLTSSAGTWNIANAGTSVSSTPASGDVKIKVSFDGSQYKLQYKDTNSPDNWVTSETIVNSSKVYMAQDATLKFLNRANNNYSCTGSTLLLNDLVITINGEEWFNGATDKEDIINYNCTETTETLSGWKDYSISGGNISFSTSLVSADKITVEVF